MVESTRFGSIKQEILDLKNEFNSIISSFKDEIHQNFDTMNNRLNTMESSLKSIISDQVKESIMKVKDSVIEALKEDNLKLQKKVESLEEQLSENITNINKIDQYNRRNNIEIQGIPSSVSDNDLEKKVIDIFKCLNINIQTSDIEGCHRMGKANPQNTIVRFVNRKFCYDALEKKANLKNINNNDLGFESRTKLFFSENLTPLNQKLAWMCRELKRAGKIHSCWSSKGVVKLRRTMNERSTYINRISDITDLYPEFIFNDRSSRN